MNLISKIAIAIILLTYFFFGINHCSHQGFWHDEIYTLTFLNGFSIYDFEGGIWSGNDAILDVEYFKGLFAQDQFISNFSTQISHEGHPPLYFILLKIWSCFFGSSEVALRSFSLCCGVASFLVLFNLFREQSKRNYTPWVVLITLAVNPFLFHFFTEARMYGLAFLFAALSFNYWIKYRETKEIKSRTFLYFCLSSVALLYTHYYGVFFLSSLALYEILKDGFKRTIFNHSIAILCFLPWGLVIKRQLSFHSVHWTDGIVSFEESIIGYFKGIANLLVSPITEPSSIEQGVILCIVLSTLLLLLINNWKFIVPLIGVIFGYGLQVYLFDQLVEHHTILVPRYYLFVLIFVYWILFKAVDTTFKIPSLSLVAVYCVISSTVLVQLYKLDRAPKQMFREVAGFVDGQLDSNIKTLVFEPKGPIIVGVAYYLGNNFKMVPADEAPVDMGTSAVYIDEMLGVTYRENQYHNKQQETLDFIPFVGIFLYK